MWIGFSWFVSMACASVAQDPAVLEIRTLELVDGVAVESVEARARGWLHAYVLPGEPHEPGEPGGLDLFLRVFDAEHGLLVQDDDSGQKSVPYVRLATAAEQMLSFEVTAVGEETAGAIELCLVQLAESEETAELAEALRGPLAEIRLAMAERRFVSARESALEVHEALLELPGLDTSQTAFEMMSELGDIAHGLEFNELGIPVWRWLAAFAERTLPEHHTLRTGALGNLGVALSGAGRFQDAQDVQSEVLEACLRYQHPESAASELAHHNLATTIVNLGETHRTVELLRVCFEIADRKYPHDHAMRLRAQQNYAVALSMVGQSKRAFEMTEDVYRTQSRLLENDHTTLQALRFQYAYLLREQGRHVEARALLEQAEEVLARKLPDNHLELLKVRYEKAASMYKLGDLVGARSLMERVLEQMSLQLPEGDRALMVVRRSLAAVCRADGDLDAARQIADRIYAIESETWTEDRLEFHYMLLDRAILHQDRDEWEESLELAARALEGLARYLPPEHRDIQRARAVQAWTLSQLGRTPEALEIMAQVYTERVSTLGEEHADSLRSGADFAWQLAELGMLEELDQLVGRLADGYAKRLSTTALGLSLREAEALPLESYAQFGQRAVLNLSTRLPDELLDFGARKAFYLVETTRGLANTARRRLQLALSGEVATELGPMRAGLAAASERVARVARDGGSETDVRDAVLDKERAERALLEAIVARTDDSLVAPNADAARIAATLAADEVAVGYWLYGRTDTSALEFDRSFLAFVVRPDGSLRRVELGHADAIEAGVDRWRAAIVSGDEEATAIGIELRKLVFDPVAQAAGGARRWTVALDGKLHLVPLDALPIEGGVVGDSLPIRVRSTLSELTLALAPLTGPRRMLAFGDIDYDAAGVQRSDSLSRADPSDGARLASRLAVAPAVALRGTVWEDGFSALPDTGEEVREIRDLWVTRFPDEQPPELLEGAQATHAALFELAPSARYLHLATHGFFAPESVPQTRDSSPIDKHLEIGRFTTFEESVVGMSPMTLCGLALAGANQPTDGGGLLRGVVTAEELGTLDLSRCELAVLSACATGIGVVHSGGQGVASLQKALQAAGARSVLTSLWNVPDNATRELMTAFYRGLWNDGLSTADALWQAKNSLRAHRAPPRDWAGWVLSGEAR